MKLTKTDRKIEAEMENPGRRPYAYQCLECGGTFVSFSDRETQDNGKTYPLSGRMEDVIFFRYQIDVTAGEICPRCFANDD